MDNNVRSDVRAYNASADLLRAAVRSRLQIVIAPSVVYESLRIPLPDKRESRLKLATSENGSASCRRREWPEHRHPIVVAFVLVLLVICTGTVRARRAGTRNNEEAVRRYRIAANREDAETQFTFGQMHLAGRGGAQSYAERVSDNLRGSRARPPACSHFAHPSCRPLATRASIEPPTHRRTCSTTGTAARDWGRDAQARVGH